MIQIKIVQETRDKVELAYQDWRALFNCIKSQNFNCRQIKKNVIKYQDSISYLVQKYPYEKRFSRHLKNFKHKFAQYNQQFKIHISSMYKLFNFLHLQELTSSIEFTIDHLLSVSEYLVGHLEQKNNKILKMERQIDEWKIIKKSSMCYTCKGSVQQSKIRNLAIQIGSTVTHEELDIDYVDRGHQIIQIQKQCRNIQFQLNQMGDQTFFNEESAGLIELINQIFKVKLNNFQKFQKRQNTSQYLQKYLKQISQSLKPVQILGSQQIQELLSNKKMASSNKIVSLKDLIDNQKYINKLKLMFSEPIKKFIDKYSAILDKKSEAIKAETRQCETQTSLIKQNQATKNMEKSYNSMAKQLASIKQSKQKHQKQLIKLYESLQKNQLKLTELNTKIKTLENQNRVLTQSNNYVQAKYTKERFQLRQQIETLLSNNLTQKNQLNKKIKQQEKQLQKLKKIVEKEENMQKNNIGTQSYSTYNNLNQKQLKDQQMQTQEYQQAKIIQKNMLKTLKSLKYKHKTVQQNDQNQSLNMSFSKMKLSNIPKTHNKSKSELPFEKTAQYQFKNTKQVQFIQNSNTLLDSNSKIDERAEFCSTIKSSLKSKSIGSAKSINLSSVSLKRQKNQKFYTERKPSITNLLPFSHEKIQQKQQSSKCQKQQQKDENQHQKKQQVIKTTSSKFIIGNAKLLLPLQVNKKSIQFQQQVLKKVSKNVYQTKNRQIMAVFSHKKNVKSLLSSPSIQNQLMNQAQLKQNRYEDMLGITVKKNQYSKKTMDIFKNQRYEFEQIQEIDPQKNKMIKNLMQIINQNYDFLNQEGIIDILKDLQIHKQNLKTFKSNLTNNQFLKQKIAQKSDKFHIDKKDLQLFFSMEEASKFQKNIGLWTELDNCIMVDTNFNHLAQDIQKYFQELKEKSKITYNQYFLFVDSPVAFFKDIFCQDKNRQKAHLLKHTMKGIKPKHSVKEVFRKLIRLHKMLHKNCNHIDQFLDKIGFPKKPIQQSTDKFKAKNNTSRSTNKLKLTGMVSNRQSLIRKI